MAFNFPVPVTVGEEFTDPSGIIYVWNGYGWAIKGSGGGTAPPAPVDAYTKAESDAKYVELIGDVMTGALIMQGAPIQVRESAPAAGAFCAGANSAGTNYWGMYLGDNTGGSDFSINAYDDAGAPKPVASLSISRATGNTTLAGNLSITKANPELLLNRANQAENSLITGQLAGVPRWLIIPGSGEILETGGNTGSNFLIRSYSDTGTMLSTPLTIDRATGATTLTAPLTIINAWPNITLDKTPTTGAAIYGSTGGAVRWGIFPGLDNPETGGNSGSDFVIRRYDDAGAVFAGGDPLSINRATGNTTLSGALTVGGNVYASTNIEIVGEGYLGCNKTVDGLVGTFYHSAVAVGSIYVTSAATAYNTASDVNLKEDLKSFDAGNIIDDTQVYDFAWKQTGERAYGVVAQQAVEVYPQAITHIQQSEEHAEWWGVDYSKYVPVMLQEMKAMRERIRELEQLAGVKPPVIDPKRGR